MKQVISPAVLTDAEQAQEADITEVVDSIADSRSIIDMSHDEARIYFLKEKSYCNFDLPPYFKFQNILSEVDSALAGKRLSDFKQGNPREYDDINYKILNNKDGRYSWRPMQLIHPALYVSLVHNLTKEDNWKLICNRFKKFSDNPKIECISLPRESLSENSDKAEQITNWWLEVEQKSIELALDYECLSHTDITDCYGAIYTHSTAWALHDKEFMKKQENRPSNNPTLLGNIIDGHLQDMSHGQTNGIPQGSALMDFIAEMVLGYADFLLSEKIESAEIADYKIIRYRDDYRVFTNNPRDSEKIIKFITEIMIGLGLKLSAEKTKATTDVIRGSIKSDKLYWMKQKQREGSLQKHFLIIHGLAHEHPNSGSLTIALNDYYARLMKFKNLQGGIIPLISIATDIANKNPRTYPHAAAVISLLLKFINPDDQKRVMIDKIIGKFKNIPNTGHLLIWLQRITLGFKADYPFDEPLCELAAGKEVRIWNNSWLNMNLQSIISAEKIIDQDCVKKLPEFITEEEVSLFRMDFNSDV
ncbi:MAG: RNA-directed DNA polymerase [Micavibrio aeruginosavorus]|uniref:RNA-directed DNA polymerase n=1 Tax=Micavibrio aeruginosavorus TaxID=349221 RepID=A0A7T5R369_9BACT|nr:MAG: RNA-directed DNA polymerase [Micavibrio aeruginosavorus]